MKSDPFLKKKTKGHSQKTLYHVIGKKNNYRTMSHLGQSNLGYPKILVQLILLMTYKMDIVDRWEK